MIERREGGRSDETQPLPALVGGRYRVLGKVAEHGATEFFRAQDIRLGRPVTLKVLREPYREREAFARSFEDGARAMARIAHPNVARVYDCDRSDGCSFMVMEYVPGRTLRAYLSGYALPEEGGRLAEQLLAGLSAVHLAGIMHAFVTPEDVLVNDAGTLKIANLGIRKAVEAGGLDGVWRPLVDSRSLAPESLSGDDPDVVGSKSSRLLSVTPLREPEPRSDAGTPGVDAVEGTQSREADEPPPGGRHMLNAPEDRCLAADRVATGGIGGSDPTITMAGVRADGSEADTVRFPTISNPQLDVADTLHHTRPTRLRCRC